ncbi:MAG: histidinol-phosphatase [Desulfobacterales bacterium]|nr:histidinol-phosphatase [Desulfobacterales bacterium]
MIDYHVHTQLCNHAKGSMKEYVDKAVELGFKEICFLDHLTLNESGKSLSMGLLELPFYFYSVNALKDAYQGQIDIKSGLEVDFNIKYISIIEDVLNTYSFDAIGSSIHFLDDINVVRTGFDKVVKEKNLDIQYLWNKYLDELLLMLDYDYFDFICHIDVMKKYGIHPDDELNHKFDAIISKIKTKNKAVEINTSGYDHAAKEIYPSNYILKKCSEMGICITIGSDSHKPGQIGRYYERALNLAYALGYSHISGFLKRKRYDIPISNFFNFYQNKNGRVKL